MTDEQTLPDLRKEIIESLMRNTDTKPDELVDTAKEILNFINGVPSPEPHMGDGLVWLKSRVDAYSVEAKFQVDALAARIRDMAAHAATDIELIASLTKRIEAMEACRANERIDSLTKRAELLAVVADERVTRLARRVTSLEAPRDAAGLGHLPTSIEEYQARYRAMGEANAAVAKVDAPASPFTGTPDPVAVAETASVLERPEILDAH